MLKHSLKLTALAAATSLILSACGGSSSGGSTAPAQTIKGLAIDGPLAGATVTFVDCNNAQVETDNEGNFTFPQDCTSSELTVTGGIDTATDLPFTGEIKAPQRAPNEQNLIVVSPITTLIQASIDAGASPAEATQQIAAALNLSGVDLLSVDPMKNQQVYAKTVAVQQMVEQIQAVVASLGGSTTQAELNRAAFTALQVALSDSDEDLTSTATITAAISATVEAVKADLSLDIQNNLENVQTNLAALSAEVISSNVQSVETAIQNVPAATFNAGTESIKDETQAAVTEAKESVAAEKIVTALAPVLTQTLTKEAQDSLKAISTAVASPTDEASNQKIADAITQIETVVPAGTIDSTTVTEAVQKANEFYADYLELNGFNVQNTNQTITALNASLTNPIEVPSLNNLLVGISAKGIHTTTASPIVAAAALHISTGTKTLTISANKLNLNFNAGTLTAATIPADTEIKVDSTINSLKTTITINADKDVLSNGKIALNTTTLGSLSASLATQLNSFSLKGDTVTVTAVIKALPVIAINNGKPALASKYTLGTTDGSGVSAKFKVTQ